LFIAFVAFSTIYDVARGAYMHRRFGQRNTLAAHPVGLFIGAVFVVASRLAHFQPGSIYGLFTALRFQEVPDEKAEGRGLALAAVAVGLIGFLGWLVWGPIHAAAGKVGASFPVLLGDASLGTF